MVEEKRHLDAIAELLETFPAERLAFAMGQLGSAVAACDSFGIDVEAWLSELRKLVPKPAILVPPKRQTS